MEPQGGVEQDEEGGVEEAVQDAKVEGPRVPRLLVLQRQVDALRPPAEKEGCGEDGEYEGGLVRLRLCLTLPHHLGQDEAVGDHDDDGGHSEQADRHAPDPGLALEGKGAGVEISN